MALLSGWLSPVPRHYHNSGRNLTHCLNRWDSQVPDGVAKSTPGGPVNHLRCNICMSHRQFRNLLCSRRAVLVQSSHMPSLPQFSFSPHMATFHIISRKFSLFASNKGSACKGAPPLVKPTVWPPSQTVDASSKILPEPRDVRVRPVSFRESGPPGLGGRLPSGVGGRLSLGSSVFRFAPSGGKARTGRALRP